MHRKHYNIMAARIRERLDQAKSHDEKLGIALLAMDFIRMAEKDNDRFDKNRFIEAAQLTALIAWPEVKV